MKHLSILRQFSPWPRLGACSAAMLAVAGTPAARAVAAMIAMLAVAPWWIPWWCSRCRWCKCSRCSRSLEHQFFRVFCSKQTLFSWCCLTEFGTFLMSFAAIRLARTARIQCNNWAPGQNRTSWAPGLPGQSSFSHRATCVAVLPWFSRITNAGCPVFNPAGWVSDRMSLLKCSTFNCSSPKMEWWSWWSQYFPLNFQWQKTFVFFRGSKNIRNWGW